MLRADASSELVNKFGAAQTLTRRRRYPDLWRWSRLQRIRPVSVFESPFASSSWMEWLTYRSFRFTSSGLPAIQLDTAYSAFVQAGPLLVSACAHRDVS